MGHWKEGQKSAAHFSESAGSGFCGNFCRVLPAIVRSVWRETAGCMNSRSICLKTVIRLKIPICSRIFCPKKFGGVTRLSVIRSQLETDGTYNGQKQIDIAEFAHRQEDVRDTTATASFYLDDLIKWGNYGFVTEKVFATKAQLDAYFKRGFQRFFRSGGLSRNDWNGKRQP